MNEYIYTFLESIEYDKLLINTCVGVGLMTIFLTVFYFYYVLNIEHHIITNNINIMTTNLLSSIRPILSPHSKKLIINKLKNPDMKYQDSQVKKSNNSIKTDAINNMTIISILAIFIGYLLSSYLKINFYNIFKSNLIILVVLGLTEYSFLHILPSKIITGDPNFIKYKILTNLKNKIKFQ
jgi:hypothetical protein